MTFEEAWPHIKEGKEFKLKYHMDDFWSDWLHYSDISQRPLGLLSYAQFDIKREPREWTLNLRDGTFTESHSYVTYLNGKPPKDSDVIKVREVLND